MYMARLTQADKKTVGRYNGIFLAVYLFSTLIGNLVIGLLFTLTRDANNQVPPEIRDLTIWILAGLGCVSVIILAFTRFFLLLLLPSSPSPSLPSALLNYFSSFSFSFSSSSDHPSLSRFSILSVSPSPLIERSPRARKA